MPDAVLNGLKHYWQEKGQGEPIIMFHGATGSSATLQPLIDALADSCRVIAPDMRSMGQSAHVAEMPPSAWVDDAWALLDHLGLERAHVFGVSLGARVALRMAIDRPERVKSLHLEQPIVAMEGDTNQALNTNIGGYDRLSEAEQQFRERQHGPDWRDVLTNYMSIRNKPELQEHYNLREGAKTVRAPTLVFRSDQREVVHPLKHCFELHQSIPSSRLWIVPDVVGAPHNGALEETVRRMRETMGLAT